MRKRTASRSGNDSFPYVITGASYETIEPDPNDKQHFGNKWE